MRSRSRARPSCSRCSRRPESSTPAAPGCSRSSAAFGPPSPASRSRMRLPEASTALRRGDAPGALGVPLLHGVRDRGRRARRRRARARARAARRLAPRRRRRDARSRCTSTPTIPGAALTLGTAGGTIDGIEIADMHRQTLEREERLAGGSLEGLPDARDRGRRRRARRGQPPPLREPAGDARDRGRADDEPVHRGDRGRRRRDARDRGDRAAEQLERDPQRRAGRRRSRTSRCGSCRRGRCRRGSPR